MPSRACRFSAFLVGDHAGVDDVGEPSFEGAHGFHGGLAIPEEGSPVALQERLAWCAEGDLRVEIPPCGRSWPPGCLLAATERADIGVVVGADDGV